jgi:hypothetical protein
LLALLDDASDHGSRKSPVLFSCRLALIDVYCDCDQVKLDVSLLYVSDGFVHVMRINDDDRARAELTLMTR